VAKKKRVRKDPDPADKMIEFTRRLLNVRKSEVDELRRSDLKKKRPR
jgi:hypothetical protein